LICKARHKKYTKKIFHSDYADESIHNFSQLDELLTEVKTILKEELSKGNIKWRE